MQCLPLEDPVNGEVNITSLSVGSMAAYSCDEGFMLRGSAERTCNSDETWSGAAPTCECESIKITLCSSGEKLDGS